MCNIYFTNPKVLIALKKKEFATLIVYHERNIKLITSLTRQNLANLGMDYEEGLLSFFLFIVKAINSVVLRVIVLVSLSFKNNVTDIFDYLDVQILLFNN